MPHFFQYIPSFCLGVLLWKFGYLKTLSRGAALKIHGLMLGGAVWVLYFSPKTAPHNNYTNELTGYLIAIPLTFIVIALFDYLFHKPSRWGKFSAESSYTVYLLHMPVLAALATLIQPLGLTSAHVVFMTLFLGTTIICLGTHIFISHCPLGAFLFNGKLLPKTSQALRLQHKNATHTEPLHGTSAD